MFKIKNPFLMDNSFTIQVTVLKHSTPEKSGSLPLSLYAILHFLLFFW